MATDNFDIFLSYSRQDQGEVREIKHLLETHGVVCFLDEDCLQAGLPWLAVLEQVLSTVRAVVVVLGPHGLSPWQRREVYLALDRQANEEKADQPFPVVPLLLPGSDVSQSILFMNTWVDLREGIFDQSRIEAVLGAIRGEALPASRPVLADICPYKGLRFFCEDDASFYFGREAYTRRLLDAVKKLPVTAVIGPSGSGKSSLVYAGLLPVLRRERPPSKLWEPVSFTPGDQPYHRFAQAVLPLLEEEVSETDRLIEARKLANALSHGDLLASDIVRRILVKIRETDRLLIVCDQFEELLTLAPQAVHKPFVDMLLEVTQAPVTLLITLRADFYGHVIQLHRQLSDHLERGVVNLGPMTRDELLQTIVEPAQRVQLDFEPGLVSRLLDDVGSEPGNLPLLEFALTELWARRRGHRLITEAYESIGGVSGSIAERAETEFNKLGPQQQQATRSVLSRLVQVAAVAEGTLDSRQRVNLSNFEPNARSVIDALANARLLVTGRLEGEGTETVEVAHEALVRHWNRLRAWLDEDREFLLWRQRLSAVITEWQATGLDTGSLLGGAVLVEAERWLSERADGLYPAEVDFIKASVKQREDKRARQKRRRRQVFAGLTLGLSVMAMIAVFAGLQWRTAERQRVLAQHQRNVALSGELAMRASPLMEGAFDGALLLSVEATKLAPTFRARSALYEAITAYPHLHAFVRGHVNTPPMGARTNRSKALAFHPRDMMLAAVGGYHSTSVMLWEWRDGRPSGESLEGLKSMPIGVGFSGDGKLLAAGDRSGNIVVWDVAARRKVHRLETKVDLDRFAFHPDGRMVATVNDGEQVQLWDLQTEQAIGNPMKYRVRCDCLHAEFSPDGQTLAVGAEEKIVLLNVTGGEIVEKKVAVKQNPDPGPSIDGFNNITFNPNGKTIASHDDEVIYLWDIASGLQVGEPLPNAASRSALTFSPDGRLLASYTDDASGEGVAIHELGARKSKTLRFLYPTSDSTDYAEAAAFSPDSRYLAVYHSDDAITLWSIAEPRSLVEELGPVGGQEEYDYIYNYIYHTSDGRILVVGKSSHGVSVMEPGKGMIFSATGIDPFSGTSPAVSYSGRWLAVAADGGLHLFDLRARVEEVVSADFGEVLTVAFDPSESVLAIGNEQGDIHLYGLAADATQGAPLKSHTAGISALKFIGNGAMLASADVDGQVRLWDVTIGRFAAPPLSRVPLDVSGFSSANGLLAAGGAAAFAIWSATDGSLVKSYGTRSGIGAPIIVSLGPEGNLLATSNLGAKGIEIWDGKGAERLGPLLSFGDGNNSFALDFSPNGKSLIAVQSGYLVRWDIDLDSWQTRACKIANRNLTTDEWQRYLGDRPYHSTCPDMTWQR